MSNHITCAACRYAVVDKQASDYTEKACKGCVFDSGCACRKKACACGEGCEFKGAKAICPGQTIRWPAIQCACSASEYYRGLLNISVKGDKLAQPGWSGCEDGMPAEGGVAS